MPRLRVNKRRFRRGVAELTHWQGPPVLGAGLKETQPLRLELVRAGTAEQRAGAFYLDRYHYLGLRVVGENIGYWVKDQRGGELAGLPFGGGAWGKFRLLGQGPAWAGTGLPALRCGGLVLRAPGPGLGVGTAGAAGAAERDCQQHSIFDPALGAGAPPGQSRAGPGGPADRSGLAGEVRAWLAVVGNVCRTGTF